MGRFFYLMGKSASGKDTMYQGILGRMQGRLERLVIYTTRPIREGEEDGREYHFVDEEELVRLRNTGAIIEERVYHTINGPWYYFTAAEAPGNRAARQPGRNVATGDEKGSREMDRLGIGTLESFVKLRDYYGKEKVFPIYIEADDIDRLQRAIKREQKEAHPNYKEVCRRYLADEEDFSEEKLRAAGIRRRFRNQDREACLQEICGYIEEVLSAAPHDE